MRSVRGRGGLRRTGAVVAAIAIVVLVSGCAELSTWMTTNWSENYARADYGTRATHPALIDGKIATVAQTPPRADPRELEIEFPELRRIRRIRIINENLYRFRLDYWDEKRDDWRTLKTVWQRRDVEGEERVIQPIFDFKGINIETRRLRIVATRTVDDRIVAKTVPAPDDKVLDRVRQVVAGTWIEYYKIIVEAPARVREVEVYGIAKK